MIVSHVKLFRDPHEESTMHEAGKENFCSIWHVTYHLNIKNEEKKSIFDTTSISIELLLLLSC